MLRQAGYATAMIDKSCTTANDNSDLAQPNRKGFDHFHGVLSHVEAHHCFPPTLYRNGEKISLPGNKEHTGDKCCHDLYLEDAKAWLNATAKNGKPFFLLYSAHIPHASLYAPEKWTAMYRGKVGPERKVPQQHYRGSDASNNVADQHPRVVALARRLFDEARTRSPIDRFNFPDSR
jgi:arylsulfatase A